jgi:preprotein translocase subunit YajC
VPEFVLLGLVLILLLGAYWSMVIFPRQRDFQKRQHFARSLSVGDEVVTYGGIVGRIIDMDAVQGIAHVEIADGVVVRLITAALMQAYDPDALAEAAQKGFEADQQPAQQ